MSQRMPTLRTILVVAQRASDYVEMRRAALAMRALGWKSQVIYFHDGPLGAAEIEVAQDIDRLRQEGVITDAEFSFYGRASRQEVLPRDEDVRRPVRYWIGRLLGKRLRQWAKTKIKSTTWLAELSATIRHLIGAAYVVSVYLRNLRGAKATLRRLQPSAILLPEDVVGPITPLVIKAGHDLNIPSIILPYTIANQQEAFRSLASNPNYHCSAWPNRLVGALFSRWVMKQGGVSLVRLPAPYIVGHVVTRTVPPDPWMMNSGFANVIAVENEAMFDYYVAAGIPQSKMQVVGAIYDDHLARFKLNKDTELGILRSELGIDNKKPLLVIGGCPDQSMSCPAGFEFDGIEDFLRQLATVVRPLMAHYEVIVRPHPNYQYMGEVLAREGLRTTLVDTARLVALSDIYLAFASATIRWAIACGVPAINYDVFHYDYDDFRGTDGIVNISHFAQLREIIAVLQPDSRTLAELRAGVARASARWGRLDGCSTLRIAELIDQMCRLEPVPRSCY